jgi:hypothetical protein
MAMASIPFPSTVAEIGRANLDSIITYMGAECWLYKVETKTPRDSLGSAFDFTYDPPVRTRVVIDWKPDINRLKALGLYKEDQLPILAFFKFVDNPAQDDYIELDVEYDTGDFITNKFEIVNRMFRGYTVEQIATWVIAPRRKG